VLQLSRRGSLCQQLHSKVKETGCCLSSATVQIAQEEKAGIQSTQEEFEFMTTADDHEETERVKVNCTSEDTLQQASV
ncbi:hypothetical protein Tco_0176447, partial [Tanacetum coccineum]